MHFYIFAFLAKAPMLNIDMKTFTLPLLLLALIGLSGCNTPTRVDFDTASISKIRSYKCYTIDTRETRAHYQGVVLSPIVDRRVERSIETVMTRRGFTQDCATPDFRITFNTIKKTKTEVTDLGMGGTPFRRYPYRGYGGYSNVSIDQYEEGTFMLDIIDETSKELVWRGTYVKRLGWDAPTDAQVLEIVTDILAQFPPG
jgi:hypothetical protein